MRSNEARKPVKGSRIPILGVSYKGGVGDIRESPALRIMEMLRRSRCRDLVQRPVRARSWPQFGLGSVSTSTTGLSEHDAVVLVTAHPGVDYAAVLEHSAVLVDLRGVTRKLEQQTEREAALVGVD